MRNLTEDEEDFLREVLGDGELTIVKDPGNDSLFLWDVDSDCMELDGEEWVGEDSNGDYTRVPDTFQVMFDQIDSDYAYDIQALIDDYGYDSDDEKQITTLASNEETPVIYSNKTFSSDELERLEELDKDGFVALSRDKNDHIWACRTGDLRKDDTATGWVAVDDKFSTIELNWRQIAANFFEFVNWSDEKPYAIAGLLVVARCQREGVESVSAEEKACNEDYNEVTKAAALQKAIDAPFDEDEF